MSVARFDYQTGTATVLRRREVMQECDRARAAGHRVCMHGGVLTIFGKPPDPRPVTEFYTDTEHSAAGPIAGWPG